MHKPKRTIVIAIIIAAVAAIAGGAYFLQSRNKAADSGLETVNLSPATEQEKRDSEQAKQDIVTDDSKPKTEPETPTQMKTVTPIVTYAGQYGNDVEVGGYVPGVTESGGTCTARYTNGATVLNKSVTAVNDATTTSCPVMTLAVSAFPRKGQWSVTVSYKSETAAGSSASKVFTIE